MIFSDALAIVALSLQQWPQPTATSRSNWVVVVDDFELVQELTRYSGEAFELFGETVDGSLRAIEQRGVTKCTLDRDRVDGIEISTLVEHILFRTVGDKLGKNFD